MIPANSPLIAVLDRLPYPPEVIAAVRSGLIDGNEEPLNAACAAFGKSRDEVLRDACLFVQREGVRIAAEEHEAAIKLLSAQKAVVAAMTRNVPVPARRGLWVGKKTAASAKTKAQRKAARKARKRNRR